MEPKPWLGGWGSDGCNYLGDPVSRREPTMFLKGNVIFYKGFKIFPLLYHVVHCLLSVLEMIPGVSLQLIAKSSEQAIASKPKMLVKTL